MLYDSRTFTLRDGRQALLRSPQPDDAQAYLNYLIARAGETDNMLRDPDEWGTADELQAHIQHASESTWEVIIICTIDGQIAGSCHLERRTLRKTRHRAELSVGSLMAYWGLGIGSLLMGEMIRIAREQGVTQLELNVFQGNERAMGLYRKFGFEQVAERPNCIHLRDGTQLNACSMFLTLE